MLNAPYKFASLIAYSALVIILPHYNIRNCYRYY